MVPKVGCMTSAVDQIVAQLPLDQLAGELGETPEAIKQAASSAVPMLLGAAQEKADDPQLHALLDQHADHTPGQPSPEAADALLGGTAQAHGLAGGGLVQKLLPYLAPIVLSYVAKRVGGKGTVGVILGEILAGASQASRGTTRSTSSTGGLGGMLGQLLSGVLRKR